MKCITSIFGILLLFQSCGSKKVVDHNDDSKTIIGVNINYLQSANSNNTINLMPCTLSDGQKSECYQIITNSTPTDHQMGPWCPTNISDDANAGGIWIENGKVHDVDGAFIENMASFYKDSNWKMYDAEGNVFITETEQDCINAANPNVGDEYKNFCVECLPSYITNVSQTFLIPAKPVHLEEPFLFSGPGNRGRDHSNAPGGNRPDGARPPRGDQPNGGDSPPRGPRGGGDSGPANRGIALNGVEFSAPAPVNNILSAYTLAPFDDAGGHINVHQGYHYHAATGISYSVKQNDGHAALIGYAADGYAIYETLDRNGKEPIDLDKCRGHYDELRGYHYHVDAPGNNNFINCLHGAFAK